MTTNELNEIDSNENLNSSEDYEDTHVKAYVISSIILAVLVGITIIFMAQVSSQGYVNVFGYSVFRVVTGSMEPTISTGSLLVSKETDIEDIQVGDIVCYRTKVEEIYGYIVTHRVVSIKTEDDGTIYLETRGDANISSDPYYADSTNLTGKVVWFSGKENVITKSIGFVSGKFGFLACIALPVLLLSGVILQHSVSSMKKELMMAKSEMERRAKEEAEERKNLLPGYETLTYDDYNEIYEALKRQLIEELNVIEENDAKTE